MPTSNRWRERPLVSKDGAIAIVSKSGWLANRPANFRERVVARSRLVTFKKGEAIFRIGDSPTGLYGLIEGLLYIEVVVGNNGGQIASIGGPGFWTGVAAAMFRHEQKLSLIAAVDSVLLHLPLRAFEELAADAEGLRQFASLLDESNEGAMAIARDLINPDIHARVASRLLAMFSPGPGYVGREIVITQADLASLCNLSRKKINEELARLEEAGAISRGYGRVSLANVASLEAAAQGKSENLAATHRARVDRGFDARVSTSTS